MDVGALPPRAPPAAAAAPPPADADPAAFLAPVAAAAATAPTDDTVAAFGRLLAAGGAPATAARRAVVRLVVEGEGGGAAEGQRAGGRVAAGRLRLIGEGVRRGGDTFVLEVMAAVARVVDGGAWREGRGATVGAVAAVLQHVVEAAGVGRLALHWPALLAGGRAVADGAGLAEQRGEGGEWRAPVEALAAVLADVFVKGRGEAAGGVADAGAPDELDDIDMAEAAEEIEAVPGGGADGSVDGNANGTGSGGGDSGGAGAGALAPADLRELGGVVDVLARYLPEAAALAVLDARSVHAGPALSDRAWIDGLMRKTLHYFTRDRRPAVRAAALAHVRGALFRHPAVYGDWIVADVLGHILLHGGEEDPGVVRADLALRAEAIVRLRLSAAALDTLFETLARAARGQRAGDDEARAAVAGLQRIITERLSVAPAAVPLRAIRLLHTAFLSPDVPPAARKEAAVALEQLSATKDGYIILHPPYMPVAESPPLANASRDSLFSGRGRIGSRRGQLAKPMVAKTVVSPFLFVHRCAPPLPRDAAYFEVGAMTDALCAALECETDAQAADAILAALHHAVLDVSLNQTSVGHETIVATLRALQRPGAQPTAAQALVAGNAGRVRVVRVILQTLAVYRREWEAEDDGVPPALDTEDALYDTCVALANAGAWLSAPAARSIKARLVDACRAAIVERARPDSCSVAVDAAPNDGQSVAVDAAPNDGRSVAVGAAPDELDFAALSTMRRLLSLDPSPAVAEAIACIVADGACAKLGDECLATEDVEALRRQAIALCAGDVWGKFREMALCVFIAAMGRVPFDRRRAICAGVPMDGVTGPLFVERCLCAPVGRSQCTMTNSRDGWNFLIDGSPLPFVITVRAQGDEVLLCQRRATSSSVSRILMRPYSSRSALHALSTSHGRVASTVAASSGEGREEDDDGGGDALDPPRATRAGPPSPPAGILPEAALPPPSPQFHDANQAAIDLLSGEALQSAVPGAAGDGWDWAKVCDALFKQAAAPPKVTELCEEEAFAIVAHFGAVSPTSIRSLAHVSDEDIAGALDNIDAEVVPSVRKIGVAYNDRGDKDHSDILAHARGSAMYHRFVCDLGTVNRMDAARLAGKEADKRGILQFTDLASLPDGDGTFFIAHRDCAQHVIFHEATLIPRGEADVLSSEAEQKSAIARPRVRDLLNLAVLVTWNASGLRFDPAAYQSQCVLVNIVISPTPDPELFRVKVLVVALHVPKFGPLTPDNEGHVVAKDALCSLVRETAVNADICCQAARNRYLDTAVASTVDQRWAEIRRLAELAR